MWPSLTAHSGSCRSRSTSISQRARRPEPGHDVLSGRYACYANYRTADGRFVAVGAIEPKFFANLCNALGCEKWAEHQYDDAAQDEIRVDLAAAFACRDRDSWMNELAGTDTCVAPVLEPAEVAGDAQYRYRKVFVEAVHPTEGDFAQVGPVLAGMPTVAEPVMLPDPAKTQTDELLLAAGVSEGKVEEMRSRGVLA